MILTCFVFLVNPAPILVKADYNLYGVSASVRLRLAVSCK